MLPGGYLAQVAEISGSFIWNFKAFFLMPSLGTRLSYVMDTKITCHSSQGTENTPNESEGTKSYSWGTRGGIQASVCIRWYISLQCLILERFENFALYPQVIWSLASLASSLERFLWQHYGQTLWMVSRQWGPCKWWAQVKACAGVW